MALGVWVGVLMLLSIANLISLLQGRHAVRFFMVTFAIMLAVGVVGSIIQLGIASVNRRSAARLSAQSAGRRGADESV